MTTTPLTDRIRHALNAAVSLPSCPPVTEHGRHRYELGCALCHGDLLVLTAAVVAAVEPELDRLRAELATAKAAGYRQAADNATEQVQLHGRDADAEMLLVFLQRGAELREQFAARTTQEH